MILGENNFHSFVCVLNILHVLFMAVQDHASVITGVFHAIIKPDVIRLSMVFDHLVVIAEDAIVLLLLAKFYLFYVSEGV